MEPRTILFNVAFWKITASHSWEWKGNDQGTLNRGSQEATACRCITWSFPLLEPTASTGLPSKWTTSSLLPCLPVMQSSCWIRACVVLVWATIAEQGSLHIHTPPDRKQIQEIHTPPDTERKQIHMPLVRDGVPQSSTLNWVIQRGMLDFKEYIMVK